MIYAPMNGDGGGGKPYEMSELITTGIKADRWSPIFGGYVVKNGICYIDMFFELIADLASAKTFPETQQGYDIFYTNFPMPKGRASVPFLGIMDKMSGTGWYDQYMVVTKASPYGTLQLAQFTPITRGSDRYALRVVGQYYIEEA